MPFGLQPTHLIVIAVVALIIFGPQRLPEIGRTVGKAIAEFRRGANDMTSQFMDEVNQANTIEKPSLPTPGTSKAFEGPGVPSGNFCIHCGKPNPAGAIYCNQCGQKVSDL